MVFGGCLSDGKSNNNVTYIDLESGSVSSYATKSGKPGRVYIKHKLLSQDMAN